MTHRDAVALMTMSWVLTSHWRRHYAVKAVQLVRIQIALHTFKSRSGVEIVAPAGKSPLPGGR